MRLLVGDIGGTNARLIMYEAPDDPTVLRNPDSISTHRVVAQKYYKNNDFLSFSEVLVSFMSIPINTEVKVKSCCFAVAGPVSNNYINFTNREGWILDGHAIAEDFGFERVQLINDFSANGYGLLCLSESELITLQKGKSVPKGTHPIALIGAGTGLGECYLTPDNNGELKSYPTEGGHVEFAPRSVLETELLSFIQKRLSSPFEETKEAHQKALPRVSVERIVSGMGLENIYEFLREKYPGEVLRELDDEYNKSKERGRLIGSKKYNYGLFKRAMEIMFAVYGGEAGNVALKYLPYGGVYIAGGIAPKNVEFMNDQDSEFMSRFLDKGRMSAIMHDFPVHVVMKEDLGLRGAHLIAMRNAIESVEKTVDCNGRLSDTQREIGRGNGLRPDESGFMYNPLVFATVLSSATAILTATSVVAALYVVRKGKFL